MKWFKRVVVTALALMALTTTVSAQSVSTYSNLSFMALGDRAKNTQYRFQAYLADTTLTSGLGVIFGELWLDDIDYITGNTSIERLGFLVGTELRSEYDQTVSAGYGYMNISGGYLPEYEEVIAKMSAGISPNWNSKHPYSFYGTFTRLPAVTFGPNIMISEVRFGGEVYVNNSTMFSVMASHGDMEDSNSRKSASITIRDYMQSGWYIGTMFYWLGYHEDMGDTYWSPTNYNLIELNGGYKFKWNNPNWQGDVMAGAGVHYIEDLYSPMGRIMADVQRKLDDRLYVRAYGGFSSSTSTVFNVDGYQWWYGGLGFVIR